MWHLKYFLDMTKENLILLKYPLSKWQCSSSIWRFVLSFSTWEYLFHTGYHSIHLSLLLFFTKKKFYSKYMFYYKKLTLMKMRYSLLAQVLWHPPLLKYNNPSDRQQTWLFGK